MEASPRGRRRIRTKLSTESQAAAGSDAGGAGRFGPGRVARETAELAGGSRPALDEARAALRGAIARLRKLEDTIAAETERRARAAVSKDDAQLSAAQLASLATHVRYQLARCLRNQGLCYPQGTADRINALTQAVELLPAIARQDLETPLAWSSRLDEIACLRWLEDYAGAEKLLANCEKREPPARVIPKLRAERIRLALARGQIDEAISESGPGGFKTEAGWAEANCASAGGLSGSLAASAAARRRQGSGALEARGARSSALDRAISRPGVDAVRRIAFGPLDFSLDRRRQR